MSAGTVGLCALLFAAACAALGRDDGKYAFPEKDPKLTANWTEDYDAAVAGALKGGKLVYVLAAIDPDRYVLGELGLWSDAKLRDYMDENFECVVIALKRDGLASASANPKFAARHDELLNERRSKGRYTWIVNPQNGKSADAEMYEKSALGLMDELEESKGKVLGRHVKKRFVEDPDAIVEPFAEKASVGRFVSKIRKPPPTPLSGWEDDPGAALNLALKKGLPLFVYYFYKESPTDRVIYGRRFSEFAKGRLVCLRSGLEYKDVGKYKHIRKSVGATEEHEALRRRLSPALRPLYPCYVIYDPRGERSVNGKPIEKKRLDEIISDIKSEISELEKTN